MSMPDSLVKSFDSSTSALAGSHAAQHRVRVVAFAFSTVVAATRPVADNANARVSSFFMHNPSHCCGTAADRCGAVSRVVQDLPWPELGKLQKGHKRQNSAGI